MGGSSARRSGCSLCSLGLHPLLPLSTNQLIARCGERCWHSFLVRSVAVSVVGTASLCAALPPSRFFHFSGPRSRLLKQCMRSLHTARAVFFPSSYIKVAVHAQPLLALPRRRVCRHERSSGTRRHS